MKLELKPNRKDFGKSRSLYRSTVIKKSAQGEDESDEEATAAIKEAEGEAAKAAFHDEVMEAYNACDEQKKEAIAHAAIETFKFECAPGVRNDWFRTAPGGGNH